MFHQILNKKKIKNWLQIIIIVNTGLFPITKLTSQNPKSVRIPHTQEIVLYSKEVNDSFYLQVALPSEYETSKNNYPVIYVLDADLTFGMTTDITRWLTFAQELPPSIVVGITYKKDWWQKRSRDYTPTKDKMKNWGDWPIAGNADNFIKFFDKEFNPLLKPYRIDWSRQTLIGLSFGGLFANYVLFKQPSLFDNYLIMNPALVWNDNYIFSLPQDVLKAITSNIQVFTAVSSLDEDKIKVPWQNMNALIRSKKLEKIIWTEKVYEGQTHISILAGAISDGLKVLLGK